MNGTVTLIRELNGIRADLQMGLYDSPLVAVKDAEESLQDWVNEAAGTSAEVLEKRIMTALHDDTINAIVGDIQSLVNTVNPN